MDSKNLFLENNHIGITMFVIKKKNVVILFTIENFLMGGKNNWNVEW
jgi:hypothetical protein